MPTVIYCDRVKHRVHQDVERIVEILSSGDDPTYLRVTPTEGAMPGVPYVYLRVASITSFHADVRGFGTVPTFEQRIQNEVAAVLGDDAAARVHRALVEEAARA